MNDPVTRLREDGLQVTERCPAMMRPVAGGPHCTADRITEDVRIESAAVSWPAVYDAPRC